RMEWSIVKNHIKEYGMRNSNTMAIAPTATIANISGVVPCVEPIYKNIYMKENMSGSFIVINNHLIDALASRGLWNKNVLQEIKIHDGSIKNVKIIPNDIKRRFKETYEIEPMWILECAARRGKWIDQAASTNIFLQTTKGKVVSDIYMLAWELGLKTTYYLRTMAATQVTKTIQTNKEIVKPGKIVNRISSDPNSGICESCQ
ncbi:MAG: ribonucleoside-diphosphate reductase subunit alpha, partial [Nanoarchaeota archaeon]|nr:ribonucleoside-diphosphate reductase subunit alpha [Nanoarchaeota archaeon]